MQDYVENKRTRQDSLRTYLLAERSTFDPHWKDIADYIRPRRARFQVSETNKGDKKNQKIINNKATTASRTLRSGMMSGITSPARPWFRLTVPDPDLSENWNVKTWLSEVTDAMTTKFLSSNLYDSFPMFYEDLGDFGTAVMFIEESFDESVIRTDTFPIGSYCIANDEFGNPGVFMREYQLTIRQIVATFGKKDEKGEITNWENFSDHVKNEWKNGRRDGWITVCHIIEPNDDFNPNRLEAKYKKYSSCQFETGGGYGAVGSGKSGSYLTDSDRARYLKESGYDQFPVLVGRWSKNAEDAYGTDCPGMTVLGDTKALQVMEKRLAQAVEKMINPPMTGPTALANQPVSILPGGTTWADVRDGQQGFRPSHEVRLSLADLRVNIDACERRIGRGMFEDLFLMLAMDERTQPATAEEIRVRQQEKLIELGPVLEQLNQGVLKRLIDMMFGFMLRLGLLPEPPEELQGSDLKIEFVSIMAQAQKLTGAAGIERAVQFALNISQITQDPSNLDKMDFDQAMDLYGDVLSVPPSLIRSDETVAQMRANRAKIQAQQAQAENMKNQAAAVASLSKADTSGENALTQMASAA